MRNRSKRDFTRINHRIRVPEVRLIDEEGEQVGVVQTRDALRRSEQAGLDLVEIAPQAKPPVCRIMDYGKYKYDQEKKKRQSRKNQSQVKLKEIKFHANVEEHDYQTKMRHAREFLDDGHRVKFSLFFRGRENAHRERGFEVMHQVQKDCEEMANIDQTPTLVGRNIIMMVSPRSGQPKS